MLNLLHSRPRFERGYIPPRHGRASRVLVAIVVFAFVAAIVVAALLFLMGPTKAATDVYPLAKRGQCPGNYSQSGAYCLPMRDARQCVPKVQGQCPANWVHSGDYCCGPAR